MDAVGLPKSGATATAALTRRLAYRARGRPRSGRDNAFIFDSPGPLNHTTAMGGFRIRNSQDLLSFLAISECGSISKAARTVNISQPALTRLVHQLEEDLGGSLFERSSRGVSLTALGHELFSHALAIRSTIQNAEQALARRAAGEERIFRIGSVSQEMTTVIAECLVPMAASHPRVSFNLNTLSVDIAAQMLQHGEIDMLVGISERILGNDMFLHDTICRSDPWPYCATDHPLAARRNISLEELAAQEWVLGTTSAQHVEAVFRSRGLPPPQVRIRIEEPNVRAVLVEDSRFISAFQAVHISRMVPGTLVRIACDWPSNHSTIGTLRLVPHDAISQELVERLQGRLASPGGIATYPA